MARLTIALSAQQQQATRFFLKATATLLAYIIYKNKALLFLETLENLEISCTETVDRFALLTDFILKDIQVSDVTSH